MELNSCPDCKSNKVTLWKCTNTDWFVNCWNCFCAGSESKSKKEAVAFWNTGLIKTHGLYHRSTI